ncbi:hypothetical protein MICAG_1650012 [Microcystis aeruginosa PCC 9808]|uniref:Uncharacterized protein n=1 Tax=Microcystis aeruginosa PCC 9808 TaxID=1160284 RepID=I4HJE7_MICAE|nr:hypothetical protein MICAG_1650012 [Microcystis aeruginosa PCC 9808]
MGVCVCIPCYISFSACLSPCQVAPHNPADYYPGGGQQTFIKDSRDANIQWGEGRAITVTSLSCR